MCVCVCVCTCACDREKETQKESQRCGIKNGWSKSREEGENWMECWGTVHCFLEKLANFEGFSKVRVEQKSERNEGTSHVDIKGKRFPGKGNRRCEI